MNKKSSLIIILLIFQLVLCYGQNHSIEYIYDATVSEWEILTPPPPEAPRINGAKVYGARPGKEFIFRIPCEGERPLQFSAEGLPDGLMIDKKKGIIKGRTPMEKRTFVINITAKNDFGSVTRDFKLVVGDKIALTPPMGWNSWGGHMLQISDELIRKVADKLVHEGLADVGFQYISLDDCWMRIDPTYYEENKEMYNRRAPGYPFDKVVGPLRDECGNILPNSFFPDMKSMTDYIHSFGLKAGIYSSPGPMTCQFFGSSFGYEKQDADQFSRWGFDLLKYDMCSYRQIMKELNEALPEDSNPIEEITIWHPMVSHLEVQDRDILYNLCQYGRQDPWSWAPNINIHTWRIGGDLNHNVQNYFKDALRIIKEYREFSKPGQWNDPDFMYIGKIHDARNKMAPPEEIPLNTNQRYQYVSLWSMIAAPFFFSANMNEIEDFTIALLRNADIANINQDELGHVAEIIRETDNHIILLKKLADESVALGIFNTDSENEQTIEFRWEDINMCCKRKVRDLWRQKDLGTFDKGINVKLSPDGCAIFTVR